MYAPEVFETKEEINEYFKGHPQCWEEFSGKADNLSKINYIFEKIKSKEEYREAISLTINAFVKKSVKNDDSSKMLTNNAVQCIDENNYKMAVIFLNQAILNAKVSYVGRDLNQTDPIYLAYFQRSIALLELQEFETALHDTEICLNIFPTYKLILQKAKCLKHLLKFEEAKRLVEEVLTDPRLQVMTESTALMEEFLYLLWEIEEDFEIETTDDTIESGYYDLWISDKVKFVSSTQMGRYLSAKEFIPKNTVYLYEKGIHILILEENIQSYCSNCNKYLNYMFWPCYGCNEVVFCDQQCVNEGMKRFHQFECGVTKLFYRFGFHWFQAFRLFLSSGIISVRNLVVFRNKVFMNPNIGLNLHNWIENHANQLQPEVKSKEESFAEFKAILTFMDNKQNMGSEETQLLLEAIETSILIEYMNVFRFEDDYVFIKFVDFLLIQRLKIYFNLFYWKERNRAGSTGICMYIMGCFINHSCVPNTYQDTTDKYLKLITIKDVKANEDLTISYGPDIEWPFFRRQKYFRDFYHFQCLCELCLEQVKTVPALQCPDCDGPVFYSNNYYNDICMKCGRKYQNFVNISELCEQMKYRIDVSLKKIERWVSVEESLNLIKHSYEVLSVLMYRESYELFAIMEKVERADQLSVPHSVSKYMRESCFYPF